MAEIARSINDFSKEGVNLPTNEIEATSLKYYQQVPPKFLTLFQNIVSMVAQYQAAFEKENFDRMGQYIVAINKAIIDYFKTGSNSLSEALNAIASDTSDKAKSLIEKKTKKSYSKEEVEEEIESIVESYKEKILNKVKAFSIYSKAGKDTNSLDSKEIAKSIEDSSNDILVKQEQEYATLIGKFSIELGSTIISKFKDIVWKINEDNLKRMQRNMRSLSSAYDTQFYSVVTKLTATANHKQTILTLLGKTLKASGIGIVNAMTYSLSRILKISFGVASLVKVLTFWGKKLFSAIGSIVMFAVKTVSTAINLTISGMKLIVGSLYKVGAGTIKIVKRTFASIFSLSKKISEKVFGFSILGAMKNSFVAFLKSYAGAYFLGYALGKIWRLVLRMSGVGDLSVVSGDYSVKDDVLMPYFNALKAKFDEKKKTIEDVINGEETKIQNIKDEVVKAVTGSTLWARMTNLIDRVNSFVREISWDKIKDFAITFSKFYTELVEPVVHTLWSAISIFVEGYVSEPRIAKRGYVGVAHGLKQFSYFAKHVRLRGGLAAMMAGTLAIGAASILGQSDKKTAEQKGDKDYPLKMGIAKKYASLYGYGEGEPESDEPKYQSISQRSSKALGGMFALIDKIKDSREREELSTRYKELERIYLDILMEQTMLWDYKEQLDDFEEFYKRNKDGVELATLIGSDLANGILFYNGQPLIDISNPLGLEAEIAILRHVTDERLFDVEKRRSEISKITTGVKSAGEIESALNAVRSRHLTLPKYMTISGAAYENRTANSGTVGSIAFSLTGLGSKESQQQDPATERMSRAWASVPRGAVSIDFNLLSSQSNQNKEFEEKQKRIEEAFNKFRDSLYVPGYAGVGNQYHFLNFLRDKYSIIVDISEIEKYIKNKENEKFIVSYLQAQGLLPNDIKDRNALIAEENEKIAAINRANRLQFFLEAIGRIVRVFEANYIDAFFNHAGFVKTNESIALFNAFKERLSSNIDSMLLKNEVRMDIESKIETMNSVSGAVEIASGIFSKALEMSLSILNEAPPDIESIVKDLNSEESKQKQREAVESFLRSQMETDDVVKEISKLLEEADKKARREEDVK